MTLKGTQKEKYFEFITDMFSAICGRNNPYKAEYVWECEYEMLTALGWNIIKNDKVSKEKRKRNQIYTNLDYLLSLTTIFDFFSKKLRMRYVSCFFR